MELKICRLEVCKWSKNSRVFKFSDISILQLLSSNLRNLMEKIMNIKILWNLKRKKKDLARIRKTLCTVLNRVSGETFNRDQLVLVIFPFAIFLFSSFIILLIITFSHFEELKLLLKFFKNVLWFYRSYFHRI